MRLKSIVKFKRSVQLFCYLLGNSIIMIIYQHKYLFLRMLLFVLFI